MHVIDDQDNGDTGSTRYQAQQGGTHVHRIEESGGPSISAHGRFVTFWGMAPQYGYPGYQIFRRDLDRRVTQLVSQAPNGDGGDGYSFGSAISANGRLVAYSSSSSNLVPGDTSEQTDVFVRDMSSRRSQQISVAPSGRDLARSSFGASLSAAGRHIAYQSYATGLVPGDKNHRMDIFVWDRSSGTTALVSVASDETQADKAGNNAQISADGRYVVWESRASNLTPRGRAGTSDIYVRDLQLGVTRIVSVNSRGRAGNAGSFEGAISARGDRVAFVSAASNLVPGDTNGKADVFVRTLRSGITSRVSVRHGGGQTRQDSYGVDISGDGDWISFDSDDPRIVTGDTNQAMDSFLRSAQ